MFVIILILYGNTLAPWLCCCAISRASASLANESPAHTDTKPSCTAKCCQDVRSNLSDSSNPTPKQQLPCPVQEQLLFERPLANIERPDLDILTYFAILGRNVVSVVDGVSVEGSIQLPADGHVPTLLMAELRLKYHHAYLC
jgi:hypothetical protein